MVLNFRCTCLNVCLLDLKADVHRKNSSESSEEVAPPSLEIVAYHSEVPEREKKPKSGHSKKRKSKTDGFMTITINDAQISRSNIRKLTQQEKIDLEKYNLERSLRQSIDSEQGPSNLAQTPRRHSNFTKSSFFIPSNVQTIIKPTGSLELSYIDNNPNEALSAEDYYFKTNAYRSGVRRIRSTALETCCPPPTLTIHPNSLEIIGANIKGTKNPLPPPSSTLVRNQHLNLCPYYGSEIVYPIAEQSDEHQTSHGPDTDLESMGRNSDSDYEENNQGSRSPLLVRLQQVDCIKMVRAIKQPPQNNVADKSSVNYNFSKIEDVDRTSATSKDALLDNDNSNSSATPEMQDARTDCFATDNECSDKKLSECSNLSYSNSSMECENAEKSNMRRSSTIKLRPCDKECAEIAKFFDDLNENVHVEAKNEAAIAENKETGAVRKKTNRKNRKKKNKSKETGNCSSLLELDLDWLFDDENDHLKYSKGSFSGVFSLLFNSVLFLFRSKQKRSGMVQRNNSIFGARC